MRTNILYTKIAIVLIWMLLSCGHKTMEEWRAECDSIGDFHDGYALCAKDNIWFFINEEGKKSTREFDEAQEFANGYAIARYYHDGQSDVVFLNKDCKEKNYPVSKTFGNVNAMGNVWVSVNGNDAILMNVETGSFRLNLDGGEYLQQVLDNGNAVVMRNPENEKDEYYRNQEWLQFAIYDADGEILVPFGKYSYIGLFKNGLAKYSTTGYVTRIFINGGMESINYILNADPDDIIYGRNYGRLGFINEDGEIAVPERYRLAMDFTPAGYAKVNPDNYPELGVYGTIIDRQGHELSGRSKIVASATYLEDGKWSSGKDEEGNYLSANNKGVVKVWGPDVKVASVNDVIATKEGSSYSFYRTTEGGLEPMFALNGTGQANEVICYRNGNVFEVYSGPQNRYCEKYDPAGHRFAAEYVQIGPRDRYCAFIFE